MEPATPSNSIDLSKALAQLIRTLVENFITIVLIFIATLTLGLGYYWFSPKTYESKMIIQSDILSESYSLKIADNINTHILGKDFEYLGSRLGLTTDEATQLKEFKIASALSPMSQQMPEKDKIIVIISVKVGDNGILPKLQEGVIKYLISNEYIKKRVEEKKKEFENLIGALDREIKMLDTLKLKISHGKFTSTRVGDVLVMDVAALYEVTADLQEKKFGAIHDLAIVDSIEVIEDLTAYGKPTWPKLSIVLLASILVAIGIFSLLISLRTSRNHKSSPAA